MKSKIGIIGLGYVGGAVAAGFELHADIKIYDKYKEFDSLEETVTESDFLFVCVPTPTLYNKGQDLSVIREALDSIQRYSYSPHDPKTIIIKSTILPGTCRQLSPLYYPNKLVHSPEFLTARSARLGFINTSRIIIGAEEPYSSEAVRCEYLFRERFEHTPIYLTRWEAAELVKYMNNCFFAMKVSYLNECYDIAESLGVDYDEVKKMFLADQRVGNSHYDVPGHDGERGYGGTCFPKDVRAFVRWAEGQRLDIDTIKAAEKVNRRVRGKCT